MLADRPYRTPGASSFPDLTGLPDSPLDLPPSAPEDRLVALLVSLLSAAERRQDAVLIRADAFDLDVAWHVLEDYRARLLRRSYPRRVPR